MGEGISHTAIKKILKSEKRQRLFWIFVVLIATGFSFYHLSRLCLFLNNWPVSTLTTKQYRRKQPFPAITVCNLNHLRRSVVAHKSIYAIIGGLKNASTKRPILGSKVVGKMLGRLGLQDVLIQMSTSSKALYSHHLDHMLMSCSFNNKPCTTRNFTKFYDYQHGNCYTFKTRDYVRKIGPDQGLQLELNVQLEEYIGKFSQTVGFKVVIHEENSVPFLSENGIIITPGTHSLIALEKSVTSRVNTETCIDTQSGKDNGQETHGATYSIQACSRDCFQTNLLQQCGCYDPWYSPNASLFEDLITKNLEIRKCNHTNEGCIDRITALFEDNQICNADVCPPPCIESTFKYQISYGVWPIEEQLIPIHARFHSKLRSVGSYLPKIHYRYTTRMKEQIRNNFAKLNVFYNTLSSQYIESFPSYTWVNFLAEVGGQASLWMGFSIWTIVETLELIYHRYTRQQQERDKYKLPQNTNEFLV
ncbi:amiloride-sensitive sodium channel subunit alpha [Patella vulgata]|uniref:amiloride-sensitive sodium channel subunit alpha n=1 Tax=Patella vulgata TaxID=6465 RepID=UPI00217FF9D4|nr:amiloride-sensitive sodium channel subunit alpha [Patella vulgata]